MKMIQHLSLIGTFLIANLAFGQSSPNSIYNLNASVQNGVLNATFYSNYTTGTIHLISIDLLGGPGHNSFHAIQQNGMYTSMTAPKGFYEVSDMGNGIKKITINQELYNDFKNKSINIVFSIEVGSQSNKLNFLYQPQQ